jgi:class 3 adenylate cyclase
MPTALARHDAIVQQAISAHSGAVFKTVGDAVYATFARAPDALAAALAHSAHSSGCHRTWPTCPIRRSLPQASRYRNLGAKAHTL